MPEPCSLQELKYPRLKVWCQMPQQTYRDPVSVVTTESNDTCFVRIGQTQCSAILPAICDTQTGLWCHHVGSHSDRHLLHSGAFCPAVCRSIIKVLQVSISVRFISANLVYCCVRNIHLGCVQVQSLKGNSGIFKPRPDLDLLTENSLVKVGVLRKIFRFLEIHITEWTGLRRGCRSRAQSKQARWRHPSRRPCRKPPEPTYFPGGQQHGSYELTEL